MLGSYLVDRDRHHGDVDLPNNPVRVFSSSTSRIPPEECDMLVRLASAASLSPVEVNKGFLEKKTQAEISQAFQDQPQTLLLISPTGWEDSTQQGKKWSGKKAATEAEKDNHKVSIDPAALIDGLAASGITILVSDDNGYPGSLTDLSTVIHLCSKILSSPLTPNIRTFCVRFRQAKVLFKKWSCAAQPLGDATTSVHLETVVVFDRTISLDDLTLLLQTAPKGLKRIIVKAISVSTDTKKMHQLERFVDFKRRLGIAVVEGLESFERVCHHPHASESDRAESLSDSASESDERTKGGRTSATSPTARPKDSFEESYEILWTRATSAEYHDWQRLHQCSVALLSATLPSTHEAPCAAAMVTQTAAIPKGCMAFAARHNKFVPVHFESLRHSALISGLLALDVSSPSSNNSDSLVEGESAADKITTATRTADVPVGEDAVIPIDIDAEPPGLYAVQCFAWYLDNFDAINAATSNTPPTREEEEDGPGIRAPPPPESISLQQFSYLLRLRKSVGDDNKQYSQLLTELLQLSIYCNVPSLKALVRSAMTIRLQFTPSRSYHDHHHHRHHYNYADAHDAYASYHDFHENDSDHYVDDRSDYDEY